MNKADKSTVKVQFTKEEFSNFKNDEHALTLIRNRFNAAALEMYKAYQNWKTNPSQ